MEKQEILDQIQDIFREVLDNEDIVLNDETTAKDIEEWDSLSHVQLVVAVEKHFKVKFTSKEIIGWKSVGDMIDSISRRI